MKSLISVIAPMYNEEAVVKEYTEITLDVLRQVNENYNYEILFVNDGAKDHTLERMVEMQKLYPNEIGIVNLSRNFGLEGAINAGLRTSKGDIIIVMDGDLQDPPALIIEMLKKYEGGADIVIASRVSRSNDNFIKRITANLYYRILDSLSGKLRLEKSAANYRLLSRRAVQKIIELPEVNTTFRVSVPFIGMKTDVVEYDRDKRVAGKTNYNFTSLIRCALDGLTGISIAPLRKIFWTFSVSLLVVIGSVIGLILSNGIWQSTFLIILIMSLFFSLLYISVALIAEYIAQIMLEVKHRPTSIIYEYEPSKNSEK